MATFDNLDLKPKTMANMVDLFKNKEYSDAYVSTNELVKVKDALDRLLVITGYEETTMPDPHNRDEFGKPKQKPCFRMNFYFVDEGESSKHYIQTEAKQLWARLKAIHMVDPDVLSSGTIRTMICEGQKKGSLGNTKYYHFAGLE